MLLLIISGSTPSILRCRNAGLCAHSAAAAAHPQELCTADADAHGKYCACLLPVKRFTNCAYVTGSSVWGRVAHFTVLDSATGHRPTRDREYFFWSWVCWCCLPGQASPGGESVCCQVVPHWNQALFLPPAGENDAHPGWWGACLTVVV